MKTPWAVPDKIINQKPPQQELIATHKHYSFNERSNQKVRREMKRVEREEYLKQHP